MKRSQLQRFVGLLNIWVFLLSNYSSLMLITATTSPLPHPCTFFFFFFFPFFLSIFLSNRSIVHYPSISFHTISTHNLNFNQSFNIPSSHLNTFTLNQSITPPIHPSIHHSFIHSFTFTSAGDSAWGRLHHRGGLVELWRTRVRDDRRTGEWWTSGGFWQLVCTLDIASNFFFFLNWNMYSVKRIMLGLI